MTGTRYELRSGPSAGSTPVKRSDVAPVDAPSARRIEQGPFRYGHRWTLGPQGYDMVPLAYRDLLDPQEDDFVTDDNLNHKLAGYFQHFLEQCYEDQADVAVWGDFKLRFGEEGKGPGPDVCVVRGVRDRDRRRGSFWFGHEPGDLVLVIEVVSRHTKSKDYKDTKAICEAKKVPELILVELLGEYLSGPYKLTGYRLDPSGAYQDIELDEEKGLVSEQTNLRICPDPEGWGLEVIDLRSGQRLLRPEEEAKRVKQEAARAELAERRAEVEAEARQQAERRAETAERQAAQTLLSILENRGFSVDAAARRRILDCRDFQELRRWTEHAFAVAAVNDLWRLPG